MINVEVLLNLLLYNLKKGQRNNLLTFGECVGLNKCALLSVYFHLTPQSLS